LLLELRSLSLSEPFLFELFDPLSLSLLPLLVSELEELLLLSLSELLLSFELLELSLLPESLELPEFPDELDELLEEDDEPPEEPDDESLSVPPVALLEPGPLYP